MQQKLQKSKVHSIIHWEEVDIKLKDIQNVVHKKYVVDISAGKVSRAREKAQDAVDGAHIA